MSALEFKAVKHAARRPGMVLRLGKSNHKYLRLTHVFDHCVYGIWVSEPENARYARRPSRIPMRQLEALATEPDSIWGRLTLPTALTSSAVAGSEREQDLDAAWDQIEPLIKAFEIEANLSRPRFSYLIREHANALQASAVTLRRLTLRYYYFGGIKNALLPLPPGAKPGQGYSSNTTTDPSDNPRTKRRGRQTLLADEKGKNNFVVSEKDINDMVETVTKLLRKGPTHLTIAHEVYLAGAFRRRHPDLYAKYVANEIVEPVTVRQLRYYFGANAKLSDELAKNLRTRERNQGYTGALFATGPGEVYEIDATGGRILLVSHESPPIVLGKPTIYLMVDRSSRFVPSVYVSLRSSSYEEVRHTLLVAFTSRERRFRALGIDIDDERWPIGRMPAVICPDRGSDFMSESMKRSVVSDLRIEVTPLPPFCPDGKAIVERLIRELKRRMAASGLKGVYAEKIKDPDSKRAARRAEAVAVHSLTEVYRAVIEIIDDHNNRPHSALKRRRDLGQAGVPPVPKDAYLWGLENITGLRSPPLSDEDYRRLLLSTDKGSISNGILRYKNRPYEPVNEAAMDIAAKSTRRAKSVIVRLDKFDPYEVYIPNSRGEWASFLITSGGAAELAGLTLDEEEALAPQSGRLSARSEHESKRARVAARGGKARRSPKGAPAVKVDRQQQTRARQQATADMKRKLTGNVPVKPFTSKPSSPATDWEQVEEQERLRNLELIRKHRSKS